MGEKSQESASLCTNPVFFCYYIYIFLQYNAEVRVVGEVKKDTITINGKSFILNHTESVEYIAKIEKYVNQKIEEASVDGMKLDSEKSMIMASINITDELFKTQRDLEEALKE